MCAIQHSFPWPNVDCPAPSTASTDFLDVSLAAEWFRKHLAFLLPVPAWRCCPFTPAQDFLMSAVVLCFGCNRSPGADAASAGRLRQCRSSKGAIQAISSG